MAEEINKDTDYDVFLNVGQRDSKLAPNSSSIHIVLENKAMSDATLTLIQSHLQEIFSDLINTNPDDVIEKIPDLDEVVSYGKIRFSLDGLHLPPDAKKKLLEKLHYYARKKGLHEFEQSTSDQTMGEK